MTDTHASLAAPEIQATLIAEALVSAKVGFLVWDETRRYIAANSRACELLGTTLETLIGSEVGSRTVDADGVVEAVVRAEGGRGRIEVERFGGTGRITLEYVTFATRTAGMPFMASVIWPAVPASEA
jgi:PAS domain-containing protein